MPDEKDNIVHIEENMGLSDRTNFLNEQIAQSVEKLEDDLAEEITKLDINDAINEVCDPTTKLSNNQKLKIMAKLFPLPLGTKVKNLLGKEGIVEMIGIDYRGPYYLVEYDDFTSRWESYPQIEKIIKPGSNGVIEIDDSPRIKTDIPDPHI